jgi:hypothetical protein
MESYYQRNKEERLEYQKNYLATLPADKKRLSQLYQQEYYQRRRAAGWKPVYKKRESTKQRITTLPKAIREKVSPVVEEKINKSKLPKPYIVEEKDFGLDYARHDQLQKLLQNAPQGFYTRPVDENPFVLTWD